MGLSIFTSTACVIGITMHLLVAGTIIKHKKEREFRGPYFKLALSVLLADFGSCLVYTMESLCPKLPIGLIYDEDGNLLRTNWASIILQKISASMANANIWGITLISVNRYYFTSNPLVANAKWTSKLTYGLIMSQWILAVVPASLHHPSLVMSWDPVHNETVLTPNFNQSMFFSSIDGFKQVACSVMIFVVYMIIFARLWKHQKTKIDVETNANRAQKSDHYREVRLAIQGALVAVFLLPTALKNGVFVFLPPPNHDNERLPGADSKVPNAPGGQGGLLSVIGDLEMANFYSTSLLMLLTSDILKRKVLGMFGLQTSGLTQAKGATSVHR